MYIYNESYFHIQRQPLWAVGSKQVIGLEENLLIRDLEKSKQIQALGLPENLEQEAILQKADYFSSYHMFVRETVFEDVRLKYFPEKPSRRNGLWLCKDGANLDYWRGKLHDANCVILNVTATGKIHKGCAKNLSSDGAVLSRLQYANEAFKYWSGVINDPASIEYLFVGQIEVIGQL